MSKAILVLDDMPKSCMECDIFNHEYLTCLGLKVNFKDIDKVQSWCPLKHLPQKRILPKDQVNGTNYGEEPWFSDGYNACLDEILGE